MNYFYYRKPWLFEESELFIPIKLENLKVPVFTVNNNLGLSDSVPVDISLKLNNEKNVETEIGIYVILDTELNFTVNLLFSDSLEMNVSNVINNLIFNLYLTELTVKNKLVPCESKDLTVNLNAPLYINSTEVSLLDTIIPVNAITEANIDYKASVDIELWAGDLIAVTVEEIYCNLNFIKTIKIDSDLVYNVNINEKTPKIKISNINMECYPVLTFQGLSGLLFKDLQPLLFKDLLLKTW